MTLNLVVPIGMVRFVFLDSQSSKVSRVEDIGEKNYARPTVPPGLVGFKAFR